MGFGSEAGDGEVEGVSAHTNYDGDGEIKVVFTRGI